MTKEELLKKINSYHFQPTAVSNLTYNDWINIYDVVSPYIKENVQICEIGTNMGFSTALLGMMCADFKGHVTTIDPFDWREGSDWVAAFKRNMEYFALSNITHIRAYSENAVKTFENESFDIIFIDGDHSYGGIKKDIMLYLPKLKKGGLLCGHDCEVMLNEDGLLDIKKINEWSKKDVLGIHLGVVVAVSELLPEAKIIGDRVWYYKNAI